MVLKVTQPARVDPELESRSSASGLAGSALAASAPLWMEAGGEGLGGAPIAAGGLYKPLLRPVWEGRKGQPDAGLAQPGFLKTLCE